MTDHIVVGIDDSTGSKAALAWSLGEAEVRSASLEAVYVFLEDAYFDHGQVATKMAGIIDDVKVETGSTIDVKSTIVFGASAPHGLVHSSSSADLLVVGASGHLSIVDRMLGSVSSACVHQAHCTVVVVRTNSLPRT